MQSMPGWCTLIERTVDRATMHRNQGMRLTIGHSFSVRCPSQASARCGVRQRRGRLEFVTILLVSRYPGISLSDRGLWNAVGAHSRNGCAAFERQSDSPHHVRASRI